MAALGLRIVFGGATKYSFDRSTRRRESSPLFKAFQNPAAACPGCLLHRGNEVHRWWESAANAGP